MKRKKKIFSLRALVFAVLVTASVSSVTLSRYMTTVTGTATASIAQFNVTMNSTATTMNFNGSTFGAGSIEAQAYPFTITSTSDVALTYRVEVDFGNTPPPTQVSLWIETPGEGEMTAKSAVQTGDGITAKFTFTDFQYALGVESISNTLYIQVDYGEGADALAFEGFHSNTVTITVTAEQAITNNP